MVETGPEIARGGEGPYHLLKGDPLHGLKLFDTVGNSVRVFQSKVKAFLAMPSFSFALKPESELLDKRGGNFCGYRLPHYSNSIGLRETIDPRGRSDLGVIVTPDDFPRLGFRIFSIAEEFAARKMVFCDWYANLLCRLLPDGHIDPDSIVAIDLTSVQLAAMHEGVTQLLLFDGAVPDYIPTELQGRDLRTTKRHFSSDVFSAAVYLLEVVSGDGSHPVAAIHKNGQLVYGKEALSLGINPLAPETLPRGFKAKPIPNLDRLPVPVRDLLRNALSPNPKDRPTAKALKDEFGAIACGRQPAVPLPVPVQMPIPASPTASASNKWLLTSICAAAVVLFFIASEKPGHERNSSKQQSAHFERQSSSSNAERKPKPGSEKRDGVAGMPRLLREASAGK